jgi:thioredoxin-dependent peroxiredoxin
VTARLKHEFENRGLKVIGLSVDSVADHIGCKRDIERTQGATVEFPMRADPYMQVAKRYGMIHPHASDRFTVRSVFVIDPNKKSAARLSADHQRGAANTCTQ